MKNYILSSCLLLAASLAAEKTIELREDHSIIGQLSPEKEKLIITSSQGKSLIIKKGAIWDLRKEANVIEIAGNTKFILEPGSKLIGNDGILRFKDDAQFIIRK